LGLGLGVLRVGLLTGTELGMKSSSLLGLAAVLFGSVSWAAGGDFAQAPPACGLDFRLPWTATTTPQPARSMPCGCNGAI